MAQETDLATMFGQVLSKAASWSKSNGNAAFMMWPEFIKDLGGTPDIANDSGYPMRRMAGFLRTVDRLITARATAPALASFTFIDSHLQRAHTILGFEKLGAGWSSLMNDIDQGMLVAFQTLGTLLQDNKLLTYPVEQAEKVADIENRIEEIWQELLDSAAAEDINAHLREFLMRHLSAIREHLAMYRYNGPADLETELHEMYGEIAFRKDALTGVDPANERQGRWLRITVGIINLLASIVTLIPNSAELPAPQTPSLVVNNDNHIEVNYIVTGGDQTNGDVP